MQTEPFLRVTRRRLSRKRRRQQQKGRIYTRIRNLFLLVCAAMILALVGLAVSFGVTYARVSASVPELDDYSSTELAQTSIVYDAEGNVVDELYGVQNRFVVGLEEVDPTLGDAVVAIEDHRFYEHRGLDFEAIGRAARENVATMSIQEGGSTITQQLVKNTYIAQEQRSIPSFERKFTEGALAWQYEKDHNKDEILEQYLNTVYFGANAYGAEAAARTYFDKSAEDLELAESAMLAGIINLPGTYDPFKDPESARARRDVVLDMMLKYGQIDQEEHDRAVAQEIDVTRGRIEYENDNEYFLDAVRKELANEYGDDTVYEGGLKIRTTLNPELQSMANEAVDNVVDPEAGDPSASLVSVDPATGAVRAMVGGSDFDEVKFNLATQAHRQPGSSFKAFVLAEAIRQGISPESMYESKDLKIPLPEGSDKPFYEVGNYGDTVRGPITIEEAAAESDNTVFVQLALDLGLEEVVDMAYDMGVTSELDAYPATSIGGLRVGVTPLEMASSYSTFANGGEHMEPYLVEEVTREEDGDEVTVEEHRLEGQRALSEDEAAVATQVLRGVVTDGTASQFHELDDEIGRPSAGKTGTTEEFADAWYVGYIPQLSTSVWVGYPGERRSMVNINGMDEINGENYPLDIWSSYMQNAVTRFPVQEFAPPSPYMNLEIKTGGRAYEEATEDGETTGGFENPFENFFEGDQPETTTPIATDPVAPQQSVQQEPVQQQPVQQQPVQEPVQQPVQQEPVQQQPVQQEPVQQQPVQQPVQQEPVQQQRVQPQPSAPVTPTRPGRGGGGGGAARDALRD